MTDPEKPAPSASPAVPRRAVPFDERWDAMWTLVFVALVVFLYASRFYHLGDRPFHHDESLFAYYGWHESVGAYNVHDPLLHGPLQIQILGLVFWVGRALAILDDGNTAARLPAALCGILAVVPLLGFRRQLGRLGVLLALVMLSVSPAFWYYSRFCRNESLIVFATLVLIWTVLRAWRSANPAPWIVAACLLAAVLVALKENWVFLLFDGVSFLALTALLGARRARWDHPWLGAGRATVLRVFLGSLWRRRYAWTAGAALALALLQVSYTNGFNPEWKKSFFGKIAENFVYWGGQHDEQRLYGEFRYYLPIVFLYETFAALLLLGALARIALRERRFVPVVLVTIVLAGLGILVGECGEKGWSKIARLVHASASEDGTLLAALHMSHPWHLGLALGVAWLTLLGAWEAFRARRVFRAWLVWWMGLSFLQYSYAGEKVPWLAIHILLPMILLAADLMAAWWRRSTDYFGRQQAAAVAFTLFCLLNLAQGYRLCLVNPTNPGELLVYNHTQPGIREIGAEMRRLCEKATGKPAVFLQGEAVWPLVWYIHGYPYIDDAEKDPSWDDIEILACDVNYANTHPEIAQRFDLVRVPLRQAWTPEPLHLLTPWAAKMEEFGQTLSLPADRPVADLSFLSEDLSAEDVKYLTEGDRSELFEIRKRYGFRAWGTLLGYIAARQPWDARERAQPYEVYIGRSRRDNNGEAP